MECFLLQTSPTHSTHELTNLPKESQRKSSPLHMPNNAAPDSSKHVTWVFSFGGFFRVGCRGKWRIKSDRTFQPHLHRHNDVRPFFAYLRGEVYSPSTYQLPTYLHLHLPFDITSITNTPIISSTTKQIQTQVQTPILQIINNARPHAFNLILG